MRVSGFKSWRVSGFIRVGGSRVWFSVSIRVMEEGFGSGSVLGLDVRGPGLWGIRRDAKSLGSYLGFLKGSFKGSIGGLGFRV